MEIGLGVLAVVVLVVLITQYNALVYLRQLVRNSWSDVDVYLKRRAQLVPNLVESVKAYASYEANVLTEVTEARSRSASLAGPTPERAQAETALALGLNRTLGLAEAYPELKADGGFQKLQEELVETERLIASARQYYNACVRDYNVKIEAFPSNLLARLGGFRPQAFFEIDSPAERHAPKV